MQDGAVDGGDDIELEVETAEDAEAQAGLDEGQVAQDEATIHSVRVQAIKFMREEHGVTIPESENKIALQVFPKVRYIYFVGVTGPETPSSGCGTCSSCQ